MQVREVVATYTIDEGSMELVVSLPANHPLGGLSVESGRLSLSVFFLG